MAGIREQGIERSAGAVPVRGTQSFVGVMAEVFKRPSLTGLEVLWRWVFWVAVLAWPASWLYPYATALASSVQGSGPGVLMGQLGALQMNFTPRIVVLLFSLVFLWAALSGGGRKLLVHRMSPELQPRFVPLFVLGVLRWFWWAVTVGVWLLLLKFARQSMVDAPMLRGAEPQWVGFCGIEILATLVIFVAWLLTSWIFPVAGIYSAQYGWGMLVSLRAACRRGPLSGKVAEINLVMGIVKIALIVLALVFSACPLPFQSVETQQFLVIWTAGVLVLYFVASDYFHVVRLSAFLRMTELFPPLPKGAADAAAHEGVAAS